MTVKTLRLAPDLAMDLDFATEGVGVVGMRGSGKTNLEVLWCERLYKAKIPFVVVDPKGDWGGIRSSADGKSPGLPIPVFGGLYATDGLPLEEHMGASIADLLVDENMSAILDVSRLSIGARARFLTDFFERLIDRHQREPHVRCVILEEAHRYIPQQVPGPLARVKEAAAAILLEGRAWGLGCWAATQRPARLNKDVMEEVGTIIVFRIGVAATNDKRTVTGWFKDENIPEFGPSITKLGNGEGWIHAPNTLGIIQRVQFNRRTTFDSAATPLVGRSGRRVATMADIDTGKIKEALSEAIERAKANDPAELKKQLAKARAELATRPTIEEREELIWWRQFATKFAPDQLPAIGAPFTGLGPLYVAGAPVEPEPVPYIPIGVLDARDHVLELASGLVVGIQGMSSVIDEAVAAIKPTKKPALRSVPVLDGASVGQLPKPAPTSRRQMSNADVDAWVGEVKLGKRERSILSVLAQYPSRTERQIAILTGYSSRASTIPAGISVLRKAGFVEPNKPIRITDAGRAALGDSVEPLPQGDALLAHWYGQLGKRERMILEHLVGIYDADSSVEEVGAATGYSTEASTIPAGMSLLRSLELVEGWHAHPDFMEAIGRG